MKLSSFFWILIVTSPLCAKSNDYHDTSITNKYPIVWRKAADSSTYFLINNYWNVNLKYFNTRNAGNVDFAYWPQAHALDALLDAYGRSKNVAYLSYINQWIAGVKQKNGNSFLNNFYDDEGWNGLAMLRAYDSTHSVTFKTATANIWDDIKKGWSELGGGGVAWSKTTPAFKNTPANGPACILAARMYQQFKKPDDLVWANKIYKWLKDSMMNAVTGSVIDGLQADKKSKSMHIYTYNQGLMIGAALEMFTITHNRAYLNDAVRVADNALHNKSITTKEGLLIDEGNGDGGLFKGVFIRYFTLLITNPYLPSKTKDKYLSFLRHNAEIAWYYGTNKQTGTFGTYWKTAPVNDSPADLTTEISGCTLIEAAALLDKEGYFNN